MSTPKTASSSKGIMNKSLLTPIRRVGLSRNVRQSKFKSPLLTPETKEFQRLEEENVVEGQKLGETNKFTQFTPIKRLGLSRKLKPRTNIEKLLTSPIINDACKTTKQNYSTESAKPLFASDEVPVMIDLEPINKVTASKPKCAASKKSIIKIDDSIPDDKLDSEDKDFILKEESINQEDIFTPKVVKRKKLIIESDSNEDFSENDKKVISRRNVRKSTLKISKAKQKHEETDESDFDDVDFSPKDVDTSTQIDVTCSKTDLSKALSEVNKIKIVMEDLDEDFCPVVENKFNIKNKRKERTQGAKNKNNLDRHNSKKMSVDSSQESIIMKTTTIKKKKSSKFGKKGYLSLKKSSNNIELNSDSDDDFLIKPKKARRILSSKENSNLSITSECLVKLERLNSRSSGNLMEISENLQTNDVMETIVNDDFTIKEAKNVAEIIDANVINAMETNADIDIKTNADFNTETNADINIDTNADIYIETNVDINTETNVNFNTETNSDNNETNGDFNTETNADINIKTNVDITTETNSANNDTNGDFNTETNADINIKTNVDITTETNSDNNDTNGDFNTETNADINIKTNVDITTETNSDNNDTNGDFNTETNADINIKTNVDINTETNSDNNETNADFNNAELNETKQKSIKIDKIDINTLRNEIYKLDKRVQDRETQLANLKQSILYKNIHNIEDLKNLTNIWKNGCQEALRDLLIKLREHGDMDMNKLLKNINIPPRIFSFDAETDSFI